MPRKERKVRECTCPKCGERKLATRHHLWPKRHYGTERNSRVVILCKECHRKLEMRIPYKRIPHRFYVAIYLTFMLEGSYAVRLLQEGNAGVVR